MPASNSFHIVDYFVFFGTIVISMAIGVFHTIRAKTKGTTSEFFLGNRQMKLIPTGVSMLLSILVQGSVVLGVPAEMFAFGTQYYMVNLSTVIGLIIGGLTFVPLYYPLKLTSSNEVRSFITY